MKGLEKITERILAEANAQADEVKAEAAAKAEEITKQYKEQAEASYQEMMTKGHKEAESLADRKKRAASLQSKKEILSTKQDMIEQAYAMTKKAILDMPEDEYAGFLADKAGQAVVTGNEQIVLNASDKEKVGAKVVELVNAGLAASGKNAQVSLADETAKISGGLYLKEKDISVNCSLDAILNMVREEMDVKVAKALFE